MSTQNAFTRRLLAIVGFVSLLSAATHSQAAVINIADALNQTGDYNVARDFTDISDEAVIYLSGRMTFDSVDTSEAFDVVEFNVGGNGTAYQWGHEFNTDNFSFFNPTPMAELDGTLVAGESHEVVLKFSQSGPNAGNYSLYLDPNLLATEASNTTAFTRTGGPTGVLSQLNFRGGGNGSTGVVDFTNFRIFTGGDSPFASAQAVPEPGSILIWSLVGLGLMGLGFQRCRRKP